MKTTNESYQNLTQTQRDLKIEKLYSIIEKAQLLELKGKISSTRFINLFNLYMNKITFLYSLPIIINEIEIQNRNKVTPTSSQIKKTVTKKLFKLYSQDNRIFILGRFNNFLIRTKKISFETYSNNHHRTNKKLEFNYQQRQLLIAS